MNFQIIKSLVIIMAFFAFTLAGCKKDNGQDLSNIEKLPCSITADKVLVDKGDGIDYVADCEVQVTNGTLTVPPGVTIAFANGAGITVSNQGALKAVGTADKPIVFTGQTKAKGSWLGIFFQSNNVLNQLSYATVEYAGGAVQSSMDEKTAVGVGATDINSHTNSRALITNSTIKESDGYGLSVDFKTVITGFSTNKLTNNTLSGLKISMGYLGSLDAASDYLTGNGKPYIFVRMGDQGDFVTTDQTWKLLNAPYQFQMGTMNVYMGEILADVTVEPGVTMQFATSTGLMIGAGGAGSLNAIGTHTSPINFKGVNSGQGSWMGLFYTTASTNNILSYCTVDGGGASVPTFAETHAKGDIIVGSLYSTTAKLYLNSFVTIQNSGGYGVYIGTNASVNFSDPITYQSNVSGDKNK